jgi:hypothetical protein
MLQVDPGHLDTGLGRVVGFEPEQIAAQSILAADAQYRGLVKRLACRQPVGTATVGADARHDAVQALTHVQGIAIEDEAIADGDVLAAEGELDPIVAVTGVKVFDIGVALIAVGQARRIAVAAETFGSFSSACATRTFSRAAPIASPHFQFNQWAHD